MYFKQFNYSHSLLMVLVERKKDKGKGVFLMVDMEKVKGRGCARSLVLLELVCLREVKQHEHLPDEIRTPPPQFVFTNQVPQYINYQLRSHTGKFNKQNSMSKLTKARK